jgi:uncharacterized protein YqgC (DUF456 family)
MNFLYYFILFLVLLIGLAINLLGLPGLWLMVAGFGIYAFATGWNVFVGWPSLIALLVLALLAEVVELFAGAAGATAAGGRTRGMIGAVVGGFIGAIGFSFIPVPVVAQIVGACLGAFIGAGVMEYSDRDLAHSLRVGYGAAKGRFWGIVSKLAFGVVMLIVALAAAFPYVRAPRSPIATTPTTLRATTQPATIPTSLPTTTLAP